MIEGITILNKIAVTGLPTWIIVSAIIIAIIGFIIFAISIIAEWPTWTAIVPIIIILLVFLLCCLLPVTLPTYAYPSACVIDDSVRYNEVVDNYKIIEQRGDIWVLEDK